MRWQDLFGPLDKKYCTYFWALSAFAFVMLVAGVLGFVALFISGKSISKKAVIALVSMSITWGIMYFQNRLMYTMCAR